jgi:hypothetical protein
VEDRKNNCLFGFYDVVDTVWEAANPDAANVLERHWIAIGVTRNQPDNAVDFGDELSPQSGPAIVVPHCCTVQFGPRSRPKDDA